MKKLVLAKLSIVVLGLGFASISEEIKSNTEKQVKRNVITGHTYYLKPGTDNISGTDFNDKFVAGVGTLNDSDILDGRDGYDILDAKINNNVTPSQIKNIEEINLTFMGNYTFGMDNITGVKKLSIKGKDLKSSLIIANINSTNIDTTVTSPIDYATTDVTFKFTNNALSGSNDVFNLHLGYGDNSLNSNVFNGNIRIENLDNLSTNELETLNIYSEGNYVGHENRIDYLIVNPLKKLNIFGNHDLNICYILSSKPVYMAENGVIDASALNANLALDFSTKGIAPSKVNVIGAVKNNTIEAHFSSNDTVDITTGAGNDKIKVYGEGNVTINSGAGSDIIEVYGVKSVTINTGNGGDNITVGDSFHPLSNDATVNISTGAGGDTIRIDGGKSIAINSGDGDNIIYAANAIHPFSKDTTLNITTGAGNDKIEVFGGKDLMINTGAGNDSIDLMNYPGSAKIIIGEGRKTITFSYLNKNHLLSIIVFAKDVLNKIPVGNSSADYANIIKNFNMADDKIDFSDLVSNKPIFTSISNIINHSGFQIGNEFIVIDTNKNNSTIYYVKDGNSNGIIESNEIRLIAVVVNARLSKRNILGEEGIIEVNELINKKDESINKGDESINKGTEIIDKGSEIINKGTEMINKLNNLINIFKR